MAKAERAPGHYDAGSYILCCSSAPVPGPLMAPKSLQHLSPPDPAPVASAAVRINSHFVLQPPGALSTSGALYLVTPGGSLSFPPLPATSSWSLGFGCQTLLHREAPGATAQPGSAGPSSSGTSP